MARPIRMLAGAALAICLTVVFAACNAIDRSIAALRSGAAMIAEAFAYGFRLLAEPRVPPVITWEPAPRSMTPDHGASTSNVAYLDQHRRAGHTVHPRVQSRTDHSRGVWRAVGA